MKEMRFWKYRSIQLNEYFLSSYCNLERENILDSKIQRVLTVKNKWSHLLPEHIAKKVRGILDIEGTPDTNRVPLLDEGEARAWTLSWAWFGLDF